MNSSAQIEGRVCHACDARTINSRALEIVGDRLTRAAAVRNVRSVDDKTGAPQRQDQGAVAAGHFADPIELAQARALASQQAGDGFGWTSMEVQCRALWRRALFVFGVLAPGLHPIPMRAKLAAAFGIGDGLAARSDGLRRDLL
jgi:hypothetical protein